MKDSTKEKLCVLMYVALCFVYFLTAIDNLFLRVENVELEKYIEQLESEIIKNHS